MPAIIKSNIRSEIAKTFYGGLQAKTTQLYFMLGREAAWANDLLPPAPLSSGAYEVETRRDSVRFQSVSLSNVSLMAERENWFAGVVYDMYDTRSTTVELANAKMFVLTDDFNIYKCIFNNYGATSENKPSGVSTEYIEQPDGYVWKFMKSLSNLERTRYLTPSYMPVTDVISAGFFDGGIESVVIENGGTGYDAANTEFDLTSQDGSSAVIVPIITNGVITSFVVQNQGSGYTQASIVVSTPDANQPQGTGAVITAVIGGINLETSQADVALAAVDGEISSIYINGVGTNYTSALTTATIIGDGAGAIITPIVENGGITGFSFTNRGSGYTNATIVIAGDGVGFNGDVILAPEGGHGSSLVRESYADAIVAFLSDIDSAILGVNTPDLEYRQVAMIVNPFKYGAITNSRFRGDSGTSAWLITDPGITTAAYTVGDYLKLSGGTNELMLVAAVETGKLLLQIKDEYVPAEDDVYDKVDANSVVINSSILTVPDAITPPTVDRFSGQMLFIDNRAPFKTLLNQIANIRTLIKF